MLDVKYAPFSKVCNRCKIEKFTTFFPVKREKHRAPYLASECRECASDRAKAWQQANKDHAYRQEEQWRTDKEKRSNHL